MRNVALFSTAVVLLLCCSATESVNIDRQAADHFNAYYSSPPGIPYYHPNALTPPNFATPDVGLTMPEPVMVGQARTAVLYAPDDRLGALAALEKLDQIGNVPGDNSNSSMVVSTEAGAIAAAVLDITSSGNELGSFGNILADDDVAGLSSGRNDDFGFAQLQKEQAELHQDNLVILQQKKAIEKAEIQLRQFQQKIEEDKKILSENQANVKKWTEKMVQHVNSYRDALVAAQGGGSNNATGSNARFRETFVPVPEDALQEPSPTTPTNEPAKVNNKSPFLALFNRVRDAQLRASEAQLTGKDPVF